MWINCDTVKTQLSASKTAQKVSKRGCQKWVTLTEIKAHLSNTQGDMRLVVTHLSDKVGTLKLQ